MVTDGMIQAFMNAQSRHLLDNMRSPGVTGIRAGLEAALAAMPQVEELEELEELRRKSVSETDRWTLVRPSRLAEVLAALDAATARADAAEGAVARLREILGMKPGWSLAGGYEDGDEEGAYGWVVLEEIGAINDRDWKEISFGETPIEALEAAHRAALAPKEEKQP